jgi:uncharacterized membrane protein YkoI
MRVGRFLLISAATSVALAACARSTPDSATTSDATVTEEEPGFFAQAAISGDSAAVLAKNTAHGRITKGVLEKENGVLLFSFDIAVPGESGITEVHIDAQTGSVLKVEHE